MTFNRPKHANEMMKNAAFRVHKLAKIRYYINFRTAVTVTVLFQQTVDKIQKLQNRGLQVCVCVVCSGCVVCSVCVGVCVCV